jgi:hypothetical protein
VLSSVLSVEWRSMQRAEDLFSFYRVLAWVWVYNVPEVGVGVVD